MLIRSIERMRMNVLPLDKAEDLLSTHQLGVLIRNFEKLPQCCGELLSEAYVASLPSTHSGASGASLVSTL